MVLPPSQALPSLPAWHVDALREVWAEDPIPNSRCFTWKASRLLKKEHSRHCCWLRLQFLDRQPAAPGYTTISQTLLLPTQENTDWEPPLWTVLSPLRGGLVAPSTLAARQTRSLATT
uniref:Uncharacterized protein n=1 Tax=Mus musculus TaxID=10090 RepID=Q3UMJ2_MOUSE|nr:unnamed protein product [Mus musculus]